MTKFFLFFLLMIASSLTFAQINLSKFEGFYRLYKVKLATPYQRASYEAGPKACKNKITITTSHDEIFGTQLTIVATNDNGVDSTWLNFDHINEGVQNSDGVFNLDRYKNKTGLLRRRVVRKMKPFLFFYRETILKKLIGNRLLIKDKNHGNFLKCWYKKD